MEPLLEQSVPLLSQELPFSFANFDLGRSLIYVNFVITRHCCKKERQKTSFHLLSIDFQQDMSIGDDTDLHQDTRITYDIDVQ